MGHQSHFDGTGMSHESNLLIMLDTLGGLPNGLEFLCIIWQHIPYKEEEKIYLCVKLSSPHTQTRRM